MSAHQLPRYYQPHLESSNAFYCFCHVMYAPTTSTYQNIAKLLNHPTENIYIFFLSPSSCHADSTDFSDSLSLSLSLSLSFTIYLYHPSLPASLLDYILCPYRAVVDKSLLFVQHLYMCEVQRRTLLMSSLTSPAVSQPDRRKANWFVGFTTC